MVKVKVCGITNIADALKSIDLGADALGFNFYPPSPRFISPDHARDILLQLPPEVCKVALFVNEPREKVREVLERCRGGGGAGFGALQFHGDEGAEYCRGWALKVVKAFRIKDRASLRELAGFPADLYLLDAWAPGYGGSGETFPWNWLAGVSREKLVLAGGLDAGNVAAAVRAVQPYGVDVCTGVEARPGIKDHEKLEEFILAAKAAG